MRQRWQPVFILESHYPGRTVAASSWSEREAVFADSCEEGRLLRHANAGQHRYDSIAFVNLTATCSSAEAAGDLGRGSEASTYNPSGIEPHG